MGTLKIGILAWAVRHALQHDFTGTLKALADQGYAGLHFLGDFGGLAPAELAGVMADVSLETCAIHSGPEGLLDERGRVYDYARALNCRLVTTSLSKPDFGANCGDYAELCRQMAIVAAGNGVTLAYHNHGVEFTEVSDGIAYDLFCACLGDGVKLNANVLWAQMGGVDPIRYLTTYLPRSPIVHLGDCDADNDFCDLGQGTAPLPEIVTMLKERTEWAVLDHSNDVGKELPSAKRCIRYLRELGVAP